MATAPQETPTTEDEQLDAALAELLADVPETDAPPEGVEQAAEEGEAPAPAPQGDEEEEGEGAPSDDDEQPEGEEPQGEPEGDEDEEADLSEEHAKALRGLRLLNTPDTVLQKLSETEAITWWNSRKAAEAKTNRMLAERNKNGERPTEDGGALGVPTAAPSEPTPPSPDEQAVLAQIEEEFGSAGREALERFVSLKTREVEALRAELQRTTQQQTQRSIEAARASVGERFPGVLDDERWSSVQEAARLISQRPKYHEIEKERGAQAAFEAVFADAARLEGVREVLPEVRARRKQVDAARRSGTPNIAPHRNGKPIPKTEEGRMDMRIFYAEQGKSAAEIEALLG